MLTALTLLLSAAGPLVFTSGAETPEKVERIALPPPFHGGTPGAVTCTHYPTFTSKEVDLGGVGAERLALLPRKGRPHPAPCERERTAGEVSVTGGADAWVGYFEGARGPFAFYRSVEARRGANGFAVYDGATGDRVFADDAIGPVRVLADGKRVGLSYVKLAVAPCSPLAGGEACWERIKAQLGVGDPAPDCATSYQQANEAAAQESCQGDPQASRRCIEQELRLRPAYPPMVPPALGIEVEVKDLGADEVRPAPGAKVVSCRPAD